MSQPEKVLSETNLAGAETHTYDEAFEETGHGIVNQLALISCSLIFVYCSQEMTGMAYIITPAECDLRLTVTEKAMVNSGIFAGVVTSSIFWGRICDSYGRRRVILPTIIMAVIASFSSSLCTGFWSLFMLRTATGILVQASCATVLVYLGEMQNLAKRDTAISIAITSDQINFVIFPGFAWAVIPGTWSFYLGPLLVRPWRVFMWLWGVSGIIGAAILFFLPESPRFVLATRGAEETLMILTKLYITNKKKKASEFPVKGIKANLSLIHMKTRNLAAILREMALLLKPPLLRCFLLTHYCMMMVMLLSNGLYIWMPDLLNEVLKDTKRKSDICDIIYVKYMDFLDVTAKIHSHHTPMISADDGHCEEENAIQTTLYPLSMLMEAIFLIPYILVVILIHKYNPIHIYAVIMTICASALFICSMVPNVLIASLSITLSLCSGSGAAILSALAVQAFPTRLRALAMCTMFMIGQLGTILGIVMVSAMRGFFYCEMIFIFVCFNIYMSVLLLYWYWPDINVVKADLESKNYTF